MKTIIQSCLLLCAGLLNAQTFREGSQPLKLEWKRELNAEVSVSCLMTHSKNSQLLAAVPSGIYLITSDGQTQKYSPISSGVMGMGFFGNKIYAIGARHLTFFNQNMEKETEIALYRFDQTNLTAKNGAIYHSKLYTTHHHVDFIKYELNGAQEFRKEIAEISNNEFLQATAGYIYIYSHINKPALGPRLMQYDTLGNQKWIVAPGDVRNIIADEEGGCYALSLGDGGETTVIKYSTTGEVIWSKLLAGQFARNGFIRGDSLFLCGNVSLSAVINNKQACAFGIVSVKTGDILHQQTVTMFEDPNEREWFSQIASDGKNVYIGGSYGWQTTHPFLLKLSREGNTTGIKDEKGSRTSFNIFPNPGGSKFTISCTEGSTGTMKITVRNTLGQVVYSKKIDCNADHTFTLDMGKQAAGSYTVEMGAGEQRVVKKLVVE